MKNCINIFLVRLSTRAGQYLWFEYSEIYSYISEYSEIYYIIYYIWEYPGYEYSGKKNMDFQRKWFLSFGFSNPTLAVKSQKMKPSERDM